MTLKQAALLVMIVVAIPLWQLAGCNKTSTESESNRAALTTLADPETALSKELMVSLGQAKNFHHKADVLMSDGKLDEAADEVAKILQIPFPKDAPESEDALLDTRARLATMRIAQGQLETAMELVDGAIANARRESFFLANVHTVRGEIFEAQAAAAEAGSDEAKQAKRSAIASFDTSIQINARILKKLKTESQP